MPRAPRLRYAVGGAAVLALAAAAVVVVLVRAGTLPFNYPDRAEYPVWGLDVSHHQGPIRWAEVDTARYAFVYIKSTEGGDHSDRRFRENWEGAGAAGLARGAYHFFRFCTPAAAQARHFLATLPADAELPPAIDVEIGGNCRDVPPADTVTARLAALLTAVEEATGRAPLVYTDRTTYAAFMTRGFERYPLWFNDKYREPREPFGRTWTLWQFTAFERAPGIDGGVDLNAFAGSRAAFDQFARR
ncbi:MAG TPA: GH25 family lysozyme [Rhodothermales bacterium]|nr:GH25 family lysozyme [Rhodothermales bacterium]